MQRQSHWQRAGEDSHILNQIYIYASTPDHISFGLYYFYAPFNMLQMKQYPNPLVDKLNINLITYLLDYKYNKLQGVQRNKVLHLENVFFSSNLQYSFSREIGGNFNTNSTVNTFIKKEKSLACKTCPSYLFLHNKSPHIFFWSKRTNSWSCSQFGGSGIWEGHTGDTLTLLQDN